MAIKSFLAGLVILAGCGAAAQAFPPYLNAWENRYPTSTLADRMEALTGSRCDVCHVPPTSSSPGNCYRADLMSLIGLPIDQRIDMLDGQDSDRDGVPNGIEATTPRADLPSEVGYNMGLVGPEGTDPCGDDPRLPVTGMPETPDFDVPVASTWSLALMSVAFLGAGVLVARRRTLA